MSSNPGHVAATHGQTLACGLRDEGLAYLLSLYCHVSPVMEISELIYAKGGG